MSNFTKPEIKHILIVAIVLSFLFSFRQWGSSTFNLLEGLFNWIKFLFFVILSLIIHESAHKIIANKHHSKSEMKTWTIERFGFAPSSHSGKKFLGLIPIPKLPIGIIISLLTIFISNGKFIFAAIEHSIFSSDKLRRIKDKFSVLTNFEIAIISLAGPLISLLLALIFTSLNLYEIAKVNYYLAIYSLLPLPALDGGKIFIGSRALYIFSLIFVLFSIILIQALTLISSILLSLMIAIILIIIYYYKFE